MSRPRGHFARSKARQGDSLRHQIPAPCPHSPLMGFTLIGALCSCCYRVFQVLCVVVLTFGVFVFLLGQKGFSVYKSVPYGPVGEALAYLARRASENRDVIQRTEKERSLLWLELRRRMTLKPLT